MKVIRWFLVGSYTGRSKFNMNHLRRPCKQVDIAAWNIWPHGLIQICFNNHMLTQTLPSNRPDNSRGKFLDWMNPCSPPAPWCPPRRACCSCYWFLVLCCAVMRSHSYKQVATSRRRGTFFFIMKIVLLIQLDLRSKPFYIESYCKLSSEGELMQCG